MNRGEGDTDGIMFGVDSYSKRERESRLDGRYQGKNENDIRKEVFHRSSNQKSFNMVKELPNSTMSLLDDVNLI